MCQNDADKDKSLFLASKLILNMNGDQILNACKSFGLNGLQSNCILKPSDITVSSLLARKRKLKKFKFKSEHDLLCENNDSDVVSNKHKRKKVKKIFDIF
jgi:hypothetical protein